MSIFDFMKPHPGQSRNHLEVLRNALAALEADPEQTPQARDLRRILATRIADLENQSTPKQDQR